MRDEKEDEEEEVEEIEGAGESGEANRSGDGSDDDVVGDDKGDIRAVVAAAAAPDDDDEEEVEVVMTLSTLPNNLVVFANEIATILSSVDGSSKLLLCTMEPIWYSDIIRAAPRCKRIVDTREDKMASLGNPSQRSCIASAIGSKREMYDNDRGEKGRRHCLNPSHSKRTSDMSRMDGRIYE